MSTIRIFSTLTLLLVAHAAAAQQTATRPADVRTVTLPLNEYNRLVDGASRPAAGPPVAPLPAVLTSADLRVRVDRDSARGSFALTGDVLRPGTQRVTLLNGSTVLDASLGERPLPLLVEKESYSALLEGPGPFAATLDWGGPIVYVPGRASFALPVPPSGIARATIDVPGDQADVRVAPGLITRRAFAGGRTTIEVTLDPGSTTQVSWSMRDAAPVAAARDARALADVLSLVTVGESELRMVALVDVTVVQGEPRTFDVQVPGGYELVSLTGNSLEGSTENGPAVTVTVNNPAARRHQFLVVLERPNAGGALDFDTGFVTLGGVQRERGEIALSGTGTMELRVAEREGLTRIDVKELNTALQALSREPILAGFRYQGTPGVSPQLAFDVRRFGDAGVLAAVADRATVTTLVTAEGRALTEITLQIQNRAQPFLRVVLPAGASMVSVDVAGQAAKPALGSDGVRVPLLRTGFRPSGSYKVSFVYLHDGAPFAQKGVARMALPRMDIPVSLVEWEVFAPDQYRMRAAGGNVIDRAAFGPLVPDTATAAVQPSFNAPTAMNDASLSQGRIVVDGIGSYVADIANAQEVSFTLNGSLGESETGGTSINMQSSRPVAQPPSQNVVALQQRAAGVLPVRVDVPRAGTSHKFVRALVLDQETVVELKYSRKKG